MQTLDKILFSGIPQRKHRYSQSFSIQRKNKDKRAHRQERKKNEKQIIKMQIPTFFSLHGI